MRMSQHFCHYFCATNVTWDYHLIEHVNIKQEYCYLVLVYTTEYTW